jgi:hypothetical protein
MGRNLPGKKTTVRNLFVTFTNDQIKEAEENLGRYLDVALRIHQATHREGAPLDGHDSLHRMMERSNPSLKTNPFEHG